LFDPFPGLCGDRADLCSRKIGKKDFKELVEENQKLQSSITVTTKFKVIGVQTIAGQKKHITLIKKKLEGQNELKDYLYEIVPKEFARNISEMELLFEYEIVDFDPVFKVDMESLKEFVYFTNQKIPISEAEKIKSVLINGNLKTQSPNKLTGFSVLSAFVTGFSDTTDIRLIIEMAIIVLLIVIFLYYQFGFQRHFAGLFEGKECRELRNSIILALAKTGEKKYDEASKIYKDIHAKYSKLDPKKRKIIQGSLAELVNKMNMLFIKELADKAFSLIK
jgi:hypothetical protein